MKDKEAQIQSLLSGNRIQHSFRIPDPLYRKIIDAGRKKYGAMPDRNLTPAAFFYFAAMGVLEWERKDK